jgi:type I restriction enzyme R subunit
MSLPPLLGSRTPIRWICCATSFSTPRSDPSRACPAAAGGAVRFLQPYGPEAREILDEMLEKYTEHGNAQFLLPDILEVPPISRHGNIIEIAGRFGGEQRLMQAVHELQNLLYAS